MDEKELQFVAQQLRKPQGDAGKEVALNMNTGNELINTTTIELLGALPGEYILEIGMGNGLFVKDIVAHTPAVRYAGCDFSGTMVEEATRLNRRFIDTGQVKFMQATADHLPFDDNTFDKTFNVNTIYFWDNPARELAEIHRVLKPGGSLIIAIRPPSTMKEIPFTKFGDFRFYTREELTELLTGNGFGVTNVMEKKEPDQKIGSYLVRVSSLIVCAKAIKGDESE